MKRSPLSPARGSWQTLQQWLSRVEALPAFVALADLGEQAVFAMDEEQRIVHWNRRAEELLGFRPEEVQADPYLTSEHAAPWRRACALAADGAGEGVRLELVRADGTSVKARKYTHTFTHPDGSFAGAIEALLPQREQSSPAGAAAARLPLPDKGTVTFHGMISRDPKMHQAFVIIRNVAETDSTVLVRGESGTGKELAARAIHELSHRRNDPFLAVNCAALTPSLLESELFGHVRGAFTGAVKDHAGLFQRANGGTVFLDEVAELPLDLQAKLLRVLQERTFRPVGGERAVQVDVRIVSATHRALREEVKAGRFREDLMYRLRVVPIFLPPLRERRADISLLLRHFIARHNARGPRRIESVAPEAMRVLLDHPWPGNVRELKNVVEYAFAVGRGPEFLPEELPPEFREPAPLTSGGRRKHHPVPPGSRSWTQHAAENDEAEEIRRALQQAAGRIEEAARRLGMSRATFWRKRKRLGI